MNKYEEIRIRYESGKTLTYLEAAARQHGIDACNELAALETANRELVEFVNKFLNNFETCTDCNDDDDPDIDTCWTCQGTRKRISSQGMLYVELPQEAALLAKTEAK